MAFSNLFKPQAAAGSSVRANASDANWRSSEIQRLKAARSAPLWNTGFLKGPRELNERQVAALESGNVDDIAGSYTAFDQHQAATARHTKTANLVGGLALGGLIGAGALGLGGAAASSGTALSSTPAVLAGEGSASLFGGAAAASTPAMTTLAGPTGTALLGSTAPTATLGIGGTAAAGAGTAAGLAEASEGTKAVASKGVFGTSVSASEALLGASAVQTLTAKKPEMPSMAAVDADASAPASATVDFETRDKSRARTPFLEDSDDYLGGGQFGKRSAKRSGGAARSALFGARY